ncbi:hypothetical protein AURDEDRAFT_122119 [Auricularia subglabra TFB-10046 SS5]|nr:hypothetical protein AURDEDRAFT_122119 [Auricularia subglabra TFB-10046 SS5]
MRLLREAQSLRKTMNKSYIAKTICCSWRVSTDPTVTLAVGAQQLAKHKASVTRIMVIEELAGVTILCSDKTGALTINKLTIDTQLVETYGPFSSNDVILLSAYASRIENHDAIDTCVVGSLADPTKARAGIKLLDFKPFNPVDKRTKITYRKESTGKLKRVTKSMTRAIMDLVSRNKTEELEDRLVVDVQEFADRGLRVKVKMVSGDQLAIAKETGRGGDAHCAASTFSSTGASSSAAVWVPRTPYAQPVSWSLPTSFTTSRPTSRLRVVLELGDDDVDEVDEQLGMKLNKKDDEMDTSTGTEFGQIERSKPILGEAFANMESLSECLPQCKYLFRTLMHGVKNLVLYLQKLDESHAPNAELIGRIFIDYLQAMNIFEPSQQNCADEKLVTNQMIEILRHFEHLYKEVLPLLPEMLETTNKHLAATPASDVKKRDMIVELCLTAPVRLTHLVPHLRYLMQPLGLSLQGPVDLVSQGLRTLELCIGNLQPGYIDPPLMPVLPALIRGLNRHRKPVPAHHVHAHTTIRILGKLSARSALNSVPRVTCSGLDEAWAPALPQVTVHDDLHARFAAPYENPSASRVRTATSHFARRRIRLGSRFKPLARPYAQLLDLRLRRHHPYCRAIRHPGLRVPSFMILIIALLNNGRIMTLSVDRVLPSNTPDSCDLAEIFAYAVAYGLYLTVSTVALVIIILETTFFFQDKFGVLLSGKETLRADANDPELHMIIYHYLAGAHLQRPSFALLGALVIAQVLSSIIAAHASWGFTAIHSILGAWIGILRV